MGEFWREDPKNFLVTGIATRERARKLKAICDDYGFPLAAAALQFSMREERIISTVAGMTRPERITQTLDLAR